MRRLPTGGRVNNKAEEAFLDTLEPDVVVYKRGWPDFLLLKEGKPLAVEVKPHSWYTLRHEQKEVGTILNKAGIPSYVWTPYHPEELLTPEEYEDKYRKEMEEWKARNPSFKISPPKLSKFLS